MEWIELLQWPAMVITVVAAWLVGAKERRRRLFGFACLLLGNVLWVLWGIHDGAWALVVLQGFLAITNVRGTRSNE